MALLKYLKLDPKRLPHPSRPLSTVVPASSIAAANEKVKAIVKEENMKERGPYVKFSNEAKLAIAKYAAENGVVASLRHFASRFPDLKKVALELGEIHIKQN